MAIFAKVIKNECINERHMRDNEYDPLRSSPMTEV